MANMKNAEKKILVDAKKKTSNNEYVASMRTAIKTVEKAVLSGDSKKANESLPTAIKRIDKAVSKGVTHPNTAARKKSDLTKKVNTLK